MKRNNYLKLFSALAALLLTGAAHSSRADVVVYVSVDGFSPDPVYIGVGEAVYWVAADWDGPYTISSFAGDWTPRYLYDEGDSVGLRFNESGDYEYYDAFNYNSGVVHVGNVVSDLPPNGTITNPSDGAVYTAPATVTLSVDASDPDDGVMDVEFYLGSQMMDDVYDPPYSTSITNLAEGTYTLTIVVYDYSGATATQSVNIQVVAGSSSVPSLATPGIAAGQMQLSLSGLTTGKTIVLQASSDLMSAGNWMPVQTNQAGGATMVLNLPADGANKFFRVVQLP